MRAIVYGAGAVGGVIGARLHQAGHDVVLVARGAHHDAIRDRGLRLEWPDGAETLAIPVVDHPARIEFGPDDVVLLAVKSQDTVACAEALAVSAPRSLPVVCVQNGVDNERAVLRTRPAVYGVCVMCPTGHLEPGVVVAYSAPVSGLLDVGAYPSRTDAISDEIAALFRSATFESESRPDIMRWKYGKLLMNLGNAIEAACGPRARAGELAARARAEGVACLSAAGIEFVDEEEDQARRGDRLTVRRVGGERRGGGSTWQSLARSTGDIETDYLNGEIVLLGRLHGVATPVNELLQRLAADLVRRRAEPGSVSIDELESMLRS
jgi:2-dehydropantoate 2-reductase